MHVKSKRRSSSGGSGLGGGLAKFVGGGHRAPILLGAAALGYAHQHKVLEKLPLIGKAGPVTSFGLLAWGAEEILKIRVPGIVHDAATAALAISAFNIGFTAGSPGGVNVVGHEYPGGAVFFQE